MITKKKEPRRVNPDLLAQIRSGMDTAVETSRAESAGEPVQPPAYPGSPSASLAAPEPLAPLRDPRTKTNKLSMNSDANYSRATFLLDRTYRQRLKIVAVRVNKTEAYLVNLAIFNLLAEFEDPD